MVRSRALAVPVALLLGLLAAPAAHASLTLWPTCSSPPGGDFARCEHGAFPQSIVPGPDGAMWFTTARADLGRVTMAGAFTQAGVPLGAGGDDLMGGLTVGPDGALWFPAAFGSPFLYRATAASPPSFGATLSPGDTQPRQAVLGPDGAIWLAEAKSNTLGRFVPAGGGYTSFPLPPKPAGTYVGPLTVANGPDGRLWIPRPTDLLAVSTAGAAATYSIPGVEPTEVAAGPDGAMWVAAYGTDNVARVTTTGSATVFPLPAGSGPSSITTGPDGALWIGLGKFAAGIMRLTTSGSWTVTPFLFSSQVSSITTGPDGAIWFADLGASRIGRLTTGPLAAPAVMSLSPSVGPAGTVVRLEGKGLASATAVSVGGRRASSERAGAGLSVTVPAGAGAAPVVVTTPAGRSVATDATTFSYSTAAAPTAAAPAAATAPTVELGAATLSPAGVLTVSARTTAAAPFDLAVALPLSGNRARIAVAGKLRTPRAGTSKGRFVRSGATRLRLRLSATGRRAIARAHGGRVRLEVGVRLRLGGGQTSVGQRSYSLRAR